MKNYSYWAYNLPLQAWRDDSGGVGILNYMPRKSLLYNGPLEEVNEEQTEQEFFETAALHLENLARLFRKFSTDKTVECVYYPDEGMDKEKL